ncbi:MAG: PhnD/SsuA/transferrin family substrate-binding protein, partial [Terriglobia bacterium]
RNPNTLTALHNTFPIPRQIVSCRADLSPKLVAKVKQTLIKMDQSEEGREALQEFEQTTRFDELAALSHAQLSKARKLVEVEPGLKQN